MVFFLEGKASFVDVVMIALFCSLECHMIVPVIGRPDTLNNTNSFPTLNNDNTRVQDGLRMLRDLG